MKAVLLTIGVLGLAAVFDMTEPTSASTQLVTSDDVRLVSEQRSEHRGSQVMARNKNGWKNTAFRKVVSDDGDSW